jgi:hypothetical protein
MWLDDCVTHVPGIYQHGVVQAATPWSDPGSRFTALFERVVIDWLKEASFSAVARQLGLTWDEVDGIMARAVERGLERRGACEPRRIGLDETSFQKRHEYVTVVTGLDGRRVLSVLDGRTRDSVDAHFSALPASQRESVEVVAMDMWNPHMDAAAKWLPCAKMCFDRFHVARHLGDAVNTVRKAEHRRLRAAGDRTLVGTRYLWLESPASMRPERRSLLSQLKDVCTSTPCMGPEGDGGEAVGLRECRLGAEGVACLGRACLAEQAGAHAACGTDGAEAPRRHSQRSRAEGDERGGGVDEREDPADQVDGVRVPQQGALPQRDPLPPRGAGSPSEACLNPHDFLKRHFNQERLSAPQDL